MIHAYNECYLDTVQRKLSSIFELAVLEENVEIDTFTEKFLSSPVCKAMEEGDPVYVCGKSANELLGIILGREPLQIEEGVYASPEYWVGFVLSYAQWYFNKPYSELIEVFPSSVLILHYHLYHEMDIMKSMELFEKHLNNECPLKTLRKKKELSQNDLAVLSGVPVRSIKAYEQNTVDISKAQGDTLYALAKTLGCKIEDLIG